MSNFPTSANGRVSPKEVEAVNEYERFADYMKQTQFNTYAGASEIFIKAKSCLRSWYTAAFVEDFNLQDSGGRCPVEQHKSFVLWESLLDIINWLIIEDVPNGERESGGKFLQGFSKKVLWHFGQSDYNIEKLVEVQCRLHYWWGMMPQRWEDKADECSAYDHGISFCYFDDLLDHVILYHQDVLRGEFSY
ncbi:hypothetical protein [Spirosoma arcticum]